MFDGPVELHLISVLWLMVEGAKYDKTLTNHCSGSRLHQFVGKDNDHSAYLFKKYHEQYTKWRDSGIQKAHDLLSKDGQSVCVVGLDVQEYYYRIELDWQILREQITRATPTRRRQDFLVQRQLLGSKLLRCIEEVCKSYREEITPFLVTTHPDLPATATCLPIGLCSSPVIANLYLKKFDEAILENVRPAYYGRYVDDIFMVVAMHTPPDESDPIMSFMDRVLVHSGILKWDVTKKRFELCSTPGLYLQKQKCILQFFDADHSIAGLEKFQKQIEENASDFALLPVDGDDSPVAQVAYNLLYDGSVNKFRSVKAVAENRWELAGHLAKQTQLHLMTTGSVDSDLREELFRFFKGRNAINYWDMWERVIGFLVIADDPESAMNFNKMMQNEIKKIEFIFNEKELLINRVSSFLRDSLIGHLNDCVQLSFAVVKSINDGENYESRIWRKSNLIRHHLVATPLLNYTNYEGNLASPSKTLSLALDPQKVANTPRYVHFDECLGFVDSGRLQGSAKNAVKKANEIFHQFHGAELEDVSSELIGEAD